MPSHSVRRENEIDEAALDVQVGKADSDLIADVDPHTSVHQLSLGRRVQQTNPGSLFGRTGDDCIKRLTDMPGEEQSGGGPSCASPRYIG